MEWWSGRGTVNCNCSVGRRVHPIPAILYARDCEAAARVAARAAAMAALEWWKVKPEEEVYILWDLKQRSASSNEGVAQKVLVHFGPVSDRKPHARSKPQRDALMLTASLQCVGCLHCSM